MPEIKPPLADAADRKTARLDFARNIIVEAGAGTGKTTLLIDRLCLWILKQPPSAENLSPLERVIVLTFTEKAAAEIKIRLTAKLQQLIASASSEADARAAALLAELSELFKVDKTEAVLRAEKAVAFLDRAQIGTIHSFAAHLLRLYPLQAGVDPAFEVDDGRSFERIFDREWRLWLETELGPEPARGAEWKTLLKLCSLEELAELARALCGAKAADLPEKNSGAAIAKICRAKAAEALRLSTAFVPPKKAPRNLEKDLAEAARVLEDIAGSFEHGVFAPCSPAEFSKSKTKPSNWDEENFEQASAIINFAKAADPEGEKTVRLAYELLRPFSAVFRRAYARDGQVSFDELIIRARNLLRENKQARAELKKQYSALFIDEFQDTDPVQGELLLYLAEQQTAFSPDWNGLRLQAGKLFVVGDPKQSIYRFRGADISAYSEFKKLLLLQGAAECYLTVNFRSSPYIVNFANKALSAVMQEKNGYQPLYIPISASRQSVAENEDAAIWLVEDGEMKIGDSRRVQARFIADWINENAGKLILPDGKKLRRRDVAILLRASSSLDTFLEEFRRSGISYMVEEDKYFYSTQEVSDLLNLLRALENPEDKIAVAGVLRGPLGGITDAELLALADSCGFDYRLAAPSALPKVEACFAKLRAIREKNGRVPVRELLTFALETTRALELLPLAYNGEQTLSNIFKFTDIAANFGRASGESLRRFLSLADRYIENKSGEGESPLADDYLDAVSIMTVHKSKGLEFPVVIIPNISGKIGGQNAKKAVFRQDWKDGLFGLRAGGASDAAMAVLEEEERLHSQEEEIRILYVALTRAKNILLLCGGLGKQPAASMGGFLCRANMLPREAADAKNFPELKYIAKEAETGGFAAHPAAGEFVFEPQKWLAFREKIKASAERAALGGFTTPSALMAEEQKTAPEYFDREKTERSEHGKLVGRICHRVMERHDFSAPVTEDDVRRAAAYVCLRSPADDFDCVVKESLSVLKQFCAMPVYARLAKARALARELPFFFNADGKLLRGVIDLVIEEDGALSIIDYKSEQVKTGEEAARAAHYAPQAEAYRRALKEVLGRDASFETVFLRTGAAVRL